MFFRPLPLPAAGKISGSHGPHRKRLSRGFTLIELLVVIAIIAILAAILFPVFAQAREKACQTACMANMKQLALGLISYSQDYDEMFPLATNEVNLTNPTAPPVRLFDITWVNFTQPYIKNLNIFICPSFKDARQAGEPESTPNADDAGPYGKSPRITARTGGPIWEYGMPSRAQSYANIRNETYNNEFDKRDALFDGVGGSNYADGVSGVPLYATPARKCDSATQAEIVRPSEIALLVETMTWDHGAIRSDAPEFIRPRHQRSNYVNSQTAPQGWANTAFVDGHVKAMKPEQLYAIITEGATSYYKHFYGKK